MKFLVDKISFIYLRISRKFSDGFAWVNFKDFIVELSSDTYLYIVFIYRSLRPNVISFHASKTKL